jgi:CheY-like chemotaxis protein
MTESARPRALVVEDDGDLRRAMDRFLERVGFTVATSPSGDHALERVRRGERFALVVSDIHMPGLDGPGFLRAAQAFWPEIDAVIVLVTGALERQTVRFTENYAAWSPRWMASRLTTAA